MPLPVGNITKIGAGILLNNSLIYYIRYYGDVELDKQYDLVFYIFP